MEKAHSNAPGPGDGKAVGPQATVFHEPHVLGESSGAGPCVHSAKKNAQIKVEHFDILLYDYNLYMVVYTYTYLYIRMHTYGYLCILIDTDTYSLS